MTIKLKKEGNMTEDPEIVLQALTGSPIATFLRFQGSIRGVRVMILIDSRSTHNFLDSGVVKKVKIPIIAE